MAVGTVSASNTDDIWQLISTATPSAASNSSFTSISGYKKLMITWSLTGITDKMALRFNGDTTDGNYGGIAVLYYNNHLRATNLLPISGYQDSPQVGYVIFKDTDKTTPKIIESIGGISNGNATGVWLGTSAVTQVDVFPATGTMSGTIKLYGVAA